MKNVCDNCGTKLNRKDVICSHCGNVIIKDEEKEKNKKLLLIVALSVVVLLISGIVVGKLVFNNNTTDTADALTKNAQNVKEKTVVGNVPSNINKAPVENQPKTTKQGYDSNEDIVYYNGKTIYADCNGLWVYEDNSSGPKKIVDCSAQGVATNGEKIYYGQLNKYVDSNYGEKEQFDLYCVNIDGTDNKKVLSFMGDGRVLCEKGDYIYYIDYDEDYYEMSPAGLSESLYRYNTKTKKKEYIHSGAFNSYLYKDKIYFRTMIIDTGGDLQQIYCYDIDNNKVDQITKEAKYYWVVDDGKLIYQSAPTNSTKYEMRIINLDTNEDSVVVKLPDTNIYALNSKYIVYTKEKDSNRNYYIYDVKNKTEDVVNGLENIFYWVIIADDYIYFSDTDSDEYMVSICRYNAKTKEASENILNCQGTRLIAEYLNRLYIPNNTYGITVHNVD